MQVICIGVSGNLAAQFPRLSTLSSQGIDKLLVDVEFVELDMSATRSGPATWERVANEVFKAQLRAEAVIVAIDLIDLETPAATSFALGRDLSTTVIFVDSQTDMSFHSYDPTIDRALMIALSKIRDVIVYLNGTNGYFYRATAPTLDVGPAVSELVPGTLGPIGRIGARSRPGEATRVLRVDLSPNVKVPKRQAEFFSSFVEVAVVDIDPLDVAGAIDAVNALEGNRPEGVILHSSCLEGFSQADLRAVVVQALELDVPVLLAQTDTLDGTNPDDFDFDSQLLFFAEMTRATATTKLSWAIGYARSKLCIPGGSFAGSLRLAMELDQVGELEHGGQPNRLGDDIVASLSPG